MSHVNCFIICNGGFFFRRVCSNCKYAVDFNFSFIKNFIIFLYLSNTVIFVKDNYIRVSVIGSVIIGKNIIFSIDCIWFYSIPALDTDLHAVIIYKKMSLTLYDFVA